MRPEILNPLFCMLDTIKGIGQKHFKLVSNLIGGTKIADLLWHLPYNLTDRTYTCPISQIKTGRIWTGVVRVVEHLPPQKKSQPYRIVCADETGEIVLNFFKYYKDSLKKQLPVDSVKVISGKTEWFNACIQMNHPDYISEPENFEYVKSVEPIYPLCAGVTNKMMRWYVKQSLVKVPDLAEWCEPGFMKSQNFPSFKKALEKAHNPLVAQDVSPTAPARKRLAYDELLANQLMLAIARGFHKKKEGRSFQSSGVLRKKLLDALDFELTDAQKNVLQDIIKDQSSSYQGLRLVQGDVGCGKTVVAMLGMLGAVECGAQAAMMAPTEILAKQHFETIGAWAEKIGVKAALLTSKIKGKKRLEIFEGLENGDIDILIGTHALFTDDVHFKDLGFIVVDEQHRFGVEQRLKLSQKGNKPDIIVMTATPIPRTLVLTRFGDMDYSKIDELPRGRKPVDTRVMSVSKVSDVMKALNEKINAGTRIYWVCPLIEENEKSDLAAAVARFEALQKIYGSKVGLVHGKMKEIEKDAVMTRFKNGDIQILVATTVIEVGVNVSEATVMIVEQAERFGLSQLHQLRGRIKRGNQAGVCLLLHGCELSNTARERLNVMKSSEDGFLIAEKDLDLRGGGEILGTRQSGTEEFKVANLEFHKELLYTAHKDAQIILNADPLLKTERGQALRVLLYLFEQDAAFVNYKA